MAKEQLLPLKIVPVKLSYSKTKKSEKPQNYLRINKKDTIFAMQIKQSSKDKLFFTNEELNELETLQIFGGDRADPMAQTKTI